MNLAQYTAWLIGVILAVSANIISNLGLNFQKKAHSRREANKQLFHNQKNCKNISLDEEYEISLDEFGANKENNENMKQGSYVCDGVWLLGLFLQILGALLDFAALGYAPQSVVAPLGSLTLVINVCVSPCMHNEKPSFKTIIATSIIIFGAATTVASSPREDGVDSVSQVFELYENTSFLMYAILTGSFITIGWCLTQYYVYLSRNKQSRYKKKYYKQHRFVIAAIAGTMGAQNVLFAKSVSVLVIKSIQNGGKILFAYFETYLLLAGLFSTIYFQLRWLNSGLKRFSALYVAPIFQAFWITVSVLGGLIVYKEFNDMLISQKIVFPIGVIITIIGVFYLTTQGANNSNNNINNNENDEHMLAKHIKDNNIHNNEEKQGGLLLSSDDEEEKEEDINKEDINKEENEEKKEDINKEEKEDGELGDVGLMGLIKNLGELGEASIVTGSSLGKLLLDPNGVYNHINVGSNEEDKHYNIEEKEKQKEREKEILIKNKRKNKNKKRRKKKKRSLTIDTLTNHSLTNTEHYSDNAHERRRKKNCKQIMASRSHSYSPEPLTTSEMAPHEVILHRFSEKITSMFINDNNKNKNNDKNSKKQNINDYCLENTPEPISIQNSKGSIACPNNQIIDLENDIGINQSLSQSQ